MYLYIDVSINPATVQQSKTAPSIADRDLVGDKALIVIRVEGNSSDRYLANGHWAPIEVVRGSPTHPHD